MGASYTGILAGFKRMRILRSRPRGLTGSKEGRRIYRIWYAMRRKCTDPDYRLYRYAGALGIRVCREWKSFARFYEWAKSSGSKSGLCLGRIHREHGYSPKNCKWVTRAESTRLSSPARRKKPPNWTITAFGETKGPTAWCKDPRCMLSVTGLIARIRKGMRPEDAITAPPQNRGLSEYTLRELTAFGETKGVADWLRDRRCKVTSAGLADRLRRGIPVEQALSAPPFTLRDPPAARGRR